MLISHKVATLLVIISLMFAFALVASAWNPNNPAHIEEYIHYVAGKEGVSVSKVLSIARCESGFKMGAIHSTDKEYSVGVFQINLKAHPYITLEQALNPFFNISWAIDRMREGLWNWWTCARLT